MSNVYKACRISIFDDQLCFEDFRTCYTLSEAEIDIGLMRQEDFENGVVGFYGYAIISNSLFQFMWNMRNMYNKLTTRKDYLSRNNLQELAKKLLELETDFWKRQLKQQ